MNNVIANFNEINAVIAKFKAIEGDYEDNVFEGCVHYLCDSGIFTDAFSFKDALRVQAADIDCDEMGLLDCNELVKAFDNGDDLDCVQCINELEALGYEFDVA